MPSIFANKFTVKTTEFAIVITAHSEDIVAIAIYHLSFSKGELGPAVVKG
jgi:hypothetical protein